MIIRDYEKAKEQQRKVQERARAKAIAKREALIADRKANPGKYYKKPKDNTSVKKSSIRIKQYTAKKLSGEYQSIFSNDMSICYITGARTGVCPHHIFYGADKAFSEKYHFMLPLVSDWHTGENYSIHNDRRLDLKMKIKCQEYWINVLGKTKEDWHAEGVQWYSEDSSKKLA